MTFFDVVPALPAVSRAVIVSIALSLRARLIALRALLATLSTAGRATVKLKFTSRACKKLRKARKLVATLTTEARDGAGALRSQRRAKVTLGR